MGRPRKEGKFVSFYMSADICAALEKFSEEQGMTKTAVIERAVKSYIEASNGYMIRNGIRKPKIPFERYLTEI